jgi:hypothetical protein
MGRGFQPTEANLKWLRRATKAGLIEWPQVGGFQRDNWHKMMARLVAAGLVTPYPHGHTYEITSAGRRAAGCGHGKLELGFDFLNGKPRQCPDCEMWLEEEYEESWSEGEEEQTWFWLKEVQAPIPEAP